MNLSPENKQMIAQAIKDHETWIELLKQIQNGSLSMYQVAQMTEHHNSFPRALKANMQQIDSDFLHDYLKNHETGFIKLIRAILGLHNEQIFYIDDTIEKQFRHHMRETLTAQQHDILVRHFGLNGFPQETLQQLSNRHNLTRERIRQLESMALMTLRKPQHLIYLFPKEKKLYLNQLQELHEVQKLKDLYQKEIQAVAGQTKACQNQIKAFQASQNKHQPDLSLWKEVPLTEANFNVRATNVLVAHQCQSIYDVLQLTESQILSFPNAGIGTVQNIQTCLKKLNLSLLAG